MRLSKRVVRVDNEFLKTTSVTELLAMAVSFEIVMPLAPLRFAIVPGAVTLVAMSPPVNVQLVPPKKRST